MTAAIEPRRAPRWRFGPPTRRGAVFGMNRNQVILAGSFFAILWIAVSAFGPGGAFGPLLFIGTGFVLVTKQRVNGRTIDGWLAPLVAYSWAVLIRRRSWPASWRVITARLTVRSTGQAHTRGLIETGRGHRRTWSMAARVSCSGFMLDTEATQIGLVGQWGQMLNALGEGESPIVSAQWIERRTPSGNATSQALAHLDEFGHNSPAFGDYRDLVLRLAKAPSHETYLVVTTTADAARRFLANGRELRRKPRDAAAAALHVMLSRAVQAVPGVTVEPLNPDELGALTTSIVDPYVGDASATPVENFDEITIGGTTHRVAWAHQVPQEIIHPAVLSGPLLAHEDHEGFPRLVSMVATFVPAVTASQKLENRATAREAAAALASQHGQRRTARGQRRADHLAATEHETSFGVNLAEFSMFVTVSTPADGAPIDDRFHKVRASFASAGFGLTTLVGEQAAGFLGGALPTGRARQ